ncbi:hypothetical protein PF010_g24929 [Phytophthora fragariae]|uniref:Uncharacterized protein n=1 Tax=Phytophthora fragariae TaxID=53985 RepID=A0A6G0K248_9STRA|nr:hypothetical protein PF010_g24929 [Phytophthora fragariae]
MALRINSSLFLRSRIFHVLVFLHNCFPTPHSSLLPLVTASPHVTSPPLVTAPPAVHCSSAGHCSPAGHCSFADHCSPICSIRRYSNSMRLCVRSSASHNTVQGVSPWSLL